MAKGKEYIVRNAETGEQHGPYDEDALVKLAANGQIGLHDTIRSTLLSVWSPATDIPFLKDALRKEQQRLAELHAQSSHNRLMARLTLRGDYDPLAYELSREGVSYQRASIVFRALAGLLDFAILGLLALAILFLCWVAICIRILPTSAAFTVFLLLAWTAANLYYAILLKMTGQTIGQRFFGITTITGDYRPVYPARGMLYFLLLLLLGILSPLTQLFSANGRTWQEILAGVTVRRVYTAGRNLA